MVLGAELGLVHMCDTETRQGALARDSLPQEGTWAPEMTAAAGVSVP